MVCGNMAHSHRYNKRAESTTSRTSNGEPPTPPQSPRADDDNPNMIVYRKMERILERMQDEQTGVPVRTVKSFMSKIPSVFTGLDLVAWMMQYLDIDDHTEALHLAHLITAHGYLFPIDDHILTVRNDSTYYRFQTPCLLPTKCMEPENTEYAVYLCKRTMQNKQRLELADYEAENLARLQKVFHRKWEFIFMQADAHARVDKKRDKLERKVLDSQERAFWDVHRPAPGCVNTTEVEIKKACRSRKTSTSNAAALTGCSNSPTTASEMDLIRAPASMQSLQSGVDKLRKWVDRRRIKVSKVAESYQSYYQQFMEYDPFINTPEPSNPWITENVEFWEQETTMRDVPQRRVKRWGFSIYELLRDMAGKEHFAKFLEKEFSAENLKFWVACQKLRCVAQKDVLEKVNDIYNEFLAPGATDPLNVDCHIAESVRKKVENSPDRNSFEEAEEHIFNLMKNDSYNRYLRSDHYKDYLGGTKRKVPIFPFHFPNKPRVEA